VNREDLVQAGDLEDLGDVAVVADERELSAARPQTLEAAHEHAEGRGVDEGGVAEVDDDLLGPLADDLEQLLLELGRGVEVDLAREGDHERLASDPLRLDVEVHVSPCRSICRRGA
jgi:hypothetical protein